MAQSRDAVFFLDGRGMVLGYVYNCCLDSFPVWVIAQYSLGLISWSEYGAYRCWRQRMIHQESVQVKMVSLQNIVVDDGLVALRWRWVGLRGFLLT